MDHEEGLVDYILKGTVRRKVSVIPHRLQLQAWGHAVGHLLLCSCTRAKNWLWGAPSRHVVPPPHQLPGRATTSPRPGLQTREHSQARTARWRSTTLPSMGYNPETCLA